MKKRANKENNKSQLIADSNAKSARDGQAEFGIELELSGRTFNEPIYLSGSRDGRSSKVAEPGESGGSSAASGFHRGANQAAGMIFEELWLVMVH